MAKFFVGQRVRLKYRSESASSQTPIGAQGVVISMGPFAPGETGLSGKVIMKYADVAVQWDGFNYAYAIFGQLEPILDQNQPCDADFKQSLDDLLSRISTPAYGRVNVLKYIFK